MKEYPIIFSTEMVKAILEGRKTQTRRVIKPDRNMPPYNTVLCPYGKVKGRLWVRESWSVSDGTADQKYIYKADGLPHPDIVDASDHKSKGSWRSPIYMPSRASRITLEITGVRVERLQEIKTRDYLREGYPGIEKLGYGRSTWFKSLWNSLHKKEHSWEDNPWVWVISFKRI